MTQRCIFKSKLLSTFSGLCSMFSVLKLVLKCNLKAGCCFCFASLWEPLMQTAHPFFRRLRIYLFLPHSARRGDRELIVDKQRGGDRGTHSHSHPHIQKKPKKQCGSRSVFVNTFHHRETLNQQRIPWVCLSKDLTKNGESNKHE